ncbi:hypothetical protein IMG5_002970 [Ichthyophthirius multifiliis]|uniref:Chromate transporter n=1 Tax=Ichthyophthirius multifiliis TaxID=5932 RepID=G0QJ74_ICHMU|nr:hypothetical protein IMG5_002970 [Ichthyophthirius multifiliis]EGR34725.1 hypothetical protein IMG5_002970 [Ichthyophthirius multifiliis]|eukprot:XP_004040029.1 hypothetical protein IMG5_002970 [Ichthyophthirius multifiliis]
MKYIFKVTIFNSGGPMVQASVIQELFVNELKWVDQEIYQELVAVCSVIPGITVSQIIITIGSLVTNNVYGGLLGGIFFLLPSAFLMTIMGYLNNYINPTKENNYQVACEISLIFKGFACCSVAIVMQNSVMYLQYHNFDKKCYFFILMSIILYFQYQKPLYMVIILILGGFLGYVFFSDSVTRPSLVTYESVISSTEDKRFQNNGFLNKGLQLYVFILIGLILIQIMFNSEFIKFIFDFFYIGSVYFGGGYVGISLLDIQFTNQNINQTQFYNGFSVASAIPGPAVSSIANYIGTLEYGFIGSIFAFTFTFLPTFLFIQGFLPIWGQYRKDPQVQSILKGAECVSVGFVIATAIQIWIHIGQGDFITTSLLVFITLVLLAIYEVPAPYVMLISGTLTICRFMTLHNYRGVEDERIC